ncbi:maltose alpha-D-glucosyltransferase [Parvularcula dongshanensis]|uniref:Maltokinase n=1 Tax=Parvularcula dongshanensis TaxID=1173995 RepID=A0A840I2J6_9PROT|nr:maltose alpha-D-glucosyltransferase [Parvularcula dongshanensis]MBB4659059.1 maltose alpha-D-glucosyltransferase/alpha-amylase [Parvularcula dongshanensis]
MIDREQTDWYKDAIIYQTHVKAYADANNDGIGDFKGLTSKLDHIQELGATAIWLLPFYPSPLRDDGYDIADYMGVNPSYGDVDDLKEFIDAAHERGIRVITELVINHTSDQHEWFQRARHAPKGSPERDWYVWSDDPTKYDQTRIIFLDTEPSNWSWDPVAGQYYWHRFFHHQPDLNFDNPEVLKAVIDVMHFWLEAGVDGLRLDAIPYLIERDGTNNENLPETHDVLKAIRAALDERWGDRMLLAEANQWPEDTAEYFGEGNECHMAFHFPLMPRMYMAVAQEDRHPITDIMRQTPQIPEGCQWAIFLRNHDELTLEMVTSEERDYLWRTYAEDRRMRINLGIRRRLAPLLGGDRRKIELMKGLLLSMPGTPVLYYGDEIGMGDNIYLGDRDGVRTPMQWSPDRNGGFSRADPQRLYSQPIMDPVYGYPSVNVEAQGKNPASLLNWTRRLLAIRKNHKAFGRGSLRFLMPRNRRVLAYLREHEDDTILCVVNLSSRAQSVELDLSEFEGDVPVELSGRAAFPPVGQLPYLLTMPGYGFYWFRLTDAEDIPSWHETLPEPVPDLATVVLRKEETRLDAGAAKQTLESDSLRRFLPNQRWFADKTGTISSVTIREAGMVGPEDNPVHLLTADVKSTSGTTTYFVPLTSPQEEDGGPISAYWVAKLRRVADVRPLYDALSDDSLACATLEAMREETVAGRVAFRKTKALDEVHLAEDDTVARLLGEQSNSSVRMGRSAILKGIRQLHAGIHPEVEVSRFLTEVAGFENSPALLGWAELQGEGDETTALMVLHGFVENQGDAWTRFTDSLVRRLETESLHGEDREDDYAPPPVHDPFRTLGTRVGELHAALRTQTDDPAFAAEPVTKEDLAHWKDGARAFAEEAFSAGSGEMMDAFRGRRDEVMSMIDAVAALEPKGLKSRIHGDLHLGQVLVAQDDFYILDFEGEPARALEDRRRKTSPLRDVAGMLRSFDYAAAFAARRASEAGLVDADEARAQSLRWRDEAGMGFLKGYYAAVEAAGVREEDRAFERTLLRFFTLEKALYEVAYEANNRPDWLPIPLGGVLSILDGEA